MSPSLEINTTGYQEFCEIINLLKHGNRVPPPLWDTLTKLHNYQRNFEIMKTEIGITKNDFIKGVTKGVAGRPPIFLPNSIFRWFTARGMIRGSYRYAAQHINEIQRFIEEFKRSEVEIVKWVEQRIGTYLPPTIEIPSSTIYLIFSWGDGRILDKEAYIDATFAYVLGMDNAKGLIAHELHHVARKKSVGESDASSSDVMNLRKIATWFESEGIADMIFSAHSSTPARDLPILSYMLSRSKGAYSRVDEILKAFDDLILNKYPREPSSRKLYKLFDGNAYHPVSHTMAQRIEKCLGREHLVSTVGNPVKFITAYQTSAEIGGGYILSKKSIEMINKSFS
jgi:hypothetical protein